MTDHRLEAYVAMSDQSWRETSDDDIAFLFADAGRRAFAKAKETKTGPWEEVK